jgi:hypothetical protein
MKSGLLIMLLISVLNVHAQPSQEKPRRPANTEVIDNLVLPELPKGKTKADFDRDHKVTTRIADGDGEGVTDYRFKGKLYKMIVKPKTGPSYIMLDEKGDGKFVPAGEPGTKISVPMWIIHSW